MINCGTINNPFKIKAGSIEVYSGTTAPVGWLVCDGSEISRTLYKNLFDVIGTTYGAGDGSTTFNLPNAKIRFGNNYSAIQTWTSDVSTGQHAPLCFKVATNGGVPGANFMIGASTTGGQIRNFTAEGMTVGNVQYYPSNLVSVYSSGEKTSITIIKY